MLSSAPCFPTRSLLRFRVFLPLTTLNYLLSARSVLCFHSHCAIYSPRCSLYDTLDPPLCTSTYMIYALCLMLTVKFVCRRQQVSHRVALVRVSPLPVVKFVRCGVCCLRLGRSQSPVPRPVLHARFRVCDLEILQTDSKTRRHSARLNFW